MSKSNDTVFRTITTSKPIKEKYPPNIIRNQKYTWYSFPIIVLLNQFRHFFNVYFFLISFSQIFESYRIGPPITNIAPWIFVLVLTLGKEAIDDFTRYIRDKEANSEKYKVVTREGVKIIPSSSIKVSDLVVIEKNQRIPADLVVLKTQEVEGQCFIRTDQLDGETDWKLRNAVASIQSEDYSFIFKKIKEKQSELSINQEKLETLNEKVEEPEIVVIDDEEKQKENVEHEQEQKKEKNQFEDENNVSDEIESDSSEKSNNENIYANEQPVFDESDSNDEFGDIPEQEFEDDSSEEKFKDEDFSDNLTVQNRKNEESNDSNNSKHDGGENSSEIYNSISRRPQETAIQIDGSLVKISSSTKLQLNADTSLIFEKEITIFADKPHKDIYNFIGKVSCKERGEIISAPLNLDNVVWMNTVLATQAILGAVIYTGKETRAMMNTAQPRNKFGKIDEEINFYSILLCASSVIVGFIFLYFSGISSRFDITLIRFIIIFSSVIPISLKVTIDVARLFFYSNWIMKDADISGCIVRNSNIPEELGRVTYLLSDKTGTLTRNEMEMRKIHIGPICFTTELNDEVVELLKKKLHKKSRKTRDMRSKVFDLVCALALCHNVTPVMEDNERSYQASSPDEVALVKWCENVGVVLEQRTKDQVVIRILQDTVKKYKILYIFPFTSDTKRMGVIMRDQETKEVLFYLKGADMIMKKIVEKNDWLDEEVDNMAREGLRTLVIGMKRLTEAEFKIFEEKYRTANLAIHDRTEKVQEVVVQLEKNLKLLGLTGVEDRLQESVEQSLENLRNAGVKIWMLTGDKIETAISISISSRLFLKRNLYEIVRVTSREDAWETLSSLKEKMINYIIVDGASLQIMIDNFIKEFITFSATLDAVVCCRCTPTQKALVARNLRMLTSHRVACIGDGGNDVSMITEANVGIGIVGKEGNQASLAADFSILKFSDITTLFFWHGRNCYKGTAKLIQFIIHRGTIISVMQGIFSAIFSFSPIALYQGLIMVGYVCVYTFCPMWCIILDRDVSKENVFRYPELYKELVRNKILSAKSFAAWNLISFYQGSIIMILTFLQFQHELLSLTTITFTCLIVNELLIVLLMVSSINRWMILSQIISIITYILSLILLKNELKLPSNFMSFIFNLILISCAAIFFSILEMIYLRLICPPAYSKIAKTAL